MTQRPTAVILGSAFVDGLGGEQALEPLEVETPFGVQRVWRMNELEREAYVVFRHGLPHRLLPNQINYRAQAWALHELGVGALLVTSSVGVLDPQLPLFQPMLLTDLLMVDNRLPDGSACTIFDEPREGQGHLLFRQGPFSSALADELRGMAIVLGRPLPVAEVVFAYVAGPRTKTRAENRYWAQVGADVNSMSLGPEVILANELKIPTLGLVVGHKYSLSGEQNPSEATILASLERSKSASEALVRAFLSKAEAPEFANELYRFDT